jgi:hypothetical protein
MLGAGGVREARAQATEAGTIPFARAPLQTELPSGYLYYVEFGYQRHAERFLPPPRASREPASPTTAVNVLPTLSFVNVAHIRKNMKVLGYDVDDPVKRIEAFRRESNRYTRQRLWRILIGEQTRFVWASQQKDSHDHVYGSSTFYGLRPGSHTAQFTVWTEEGHVFEGSFSFLVDAAALDERGASSMRSSLDRTRRAAEGGRNYLDEWVALATSLASAADHALKREGKRFGELGPLVREWERALAALAAGQPRPSWRPQRAGETWESWRAREHAAQLKRYAEWLCAVVDPAALAAGQEPARKVAGGAGARSTRPLLDRANVTFALTGDADRTRMLLEEWATAAAAEARRQAQAGETLGSVFAPRREEWPRQLVPVATPRPDAPAVAETARAIEVTATLTDRDGQLTPADEATLRVTVRNVSRQALDDVTVQYGLTGELAAGARPIVRIAHDQAQVPGRRVFGSIPAGQALAFDLTIRTTHDLTWTRQKGGSWVFDRVARGDGKPRRKPPVETAVDLGSILAVKAVSRTSSGGEATFFDAAIGLRWGDGRPVAIQFPDFRVVAGMPPGPAHSVAYYRDGDVSDSDPGHPFIRALALRAAMYGRQWDQAGALIDAPEMPEDVAQVVENIAWFVNRALTPRNAPADLWTSVYNAELLLQEQAGFGQPLPAAKAARDGGIPVYICQEHALLFGSLLRALGIAVREVNVMSQPFIGAQVFGLRGWQDASSEAYYHGRWNYWGLFDDRGPFRDHLAHYNKWFQAYEMYVGSRSYDSLAQGAKVSRFNVGSIELGERTIGVVPTSFWLASGVWEYHGYGVAGHFRRTGTPQLGAWVAPYLSAVPAGLASRGLYAIGIHSPVTGLVEVNGKRVGLTQPIKGDPTRWFFSHDRAGLVNEVPLATYIPEGVRLYIDPADPASGVTLPQTIIFPAPAGEGAPSFTLHLVGTGDGPFEVRTTHHDARGVQRYAAVSGRATSGARIAVRGAELKPDGPRRPLPGPAQAASAGRDASPGSVWTTYPFADGRWSIDLPPGWSVRTRDLAAGEALRAEYSPAGGGRTATLWVHFRSRGGATIGQIAERDAARWRTAFKARAAGSGDQGAFHVRHYTYPEADGREGTASLFYRDVPATGQVVTVMLSRREARAAPREDTERIVGSIRQGDAGRHRLARFGLTLRPPPDAEVRERPGTDERVLLEVRFREDRTRAGLMVFTEPGWNDAAAFLAWVQQRAEKESGKPLRMREGDAIAFGAGEGLARVFVSAEDASRERTWVFGFVRDGVGFLVLIDDYARTPPPVRQAVARMIESIEFDR